MPILELIAIAIGLSMDAFAVSIATGIRLGVVTGRQTFRMAFHFGVFQAVMPVFGWYAGSVAGRFTSAFDHLIAAGILAFIGGKMIVDALKQNSPDACRNGDPTRGGTLFALSVATSIDAFAVGLGLGMLGLGIVFPSILIGIVTASFTAVGIRLGCRIGIMFSRRMEILGGIVLIGIGVKILIDHGVFAGM
jgi:manganese efflux pump family protein